MKRIACLSGLLLVTCLLSANVHTEERISFDDLGQSMSIDTKGQSSDYGVIFGVEAREGGHTSIYMRTPIPDEGCDLTDRAVIVASSDTGGTMFDAAMTSLTHNYRAAIRVEGCVPIIPGGVGTAPRVVRVFVVR